MRRLSATAFAVFSGLAQVALAHLAFAQDLHVPASLAAGADASISTTGSGKATFYLAGPGISRRNEVALGEKIQLSAQELRTAGHYVAILCSDVCHDSSFYVVPAAPASLTFLVHPSRVPVSQGDAVSGVALPFDHFHNLLLQPMTVNFQLTAGNASVMSRPVRTEEGIAWFRTSSGKQAGVLSVTATAGDLSSRRAVQQVASDPCNLRMKGQQTSKGIMVETEPVRDCSGNPLPDGTVVTFTASGPNTKSTVDAPIKQGIARAQLQSRGPAVVSVASGVVMGNEIRVGGGGQP